MADRTLPSSTVRVTVARGRKKRLLLTSEYEVVAHEGSRGERLGLGLFFRGEITLEPNETLRIEMEPRIYG